jgi:hypothetical protein
MRHLRWIPLLVLVFPASAAADDHRARTSAAISAASGSTLGGYHVTAEHEKFTALVKPAPDGPRVFNLVLDHSLHWGSHGDQDVKRLTVLTGAEWSVAFKEAPWFKLMPTLLGGYVRKSIDGDDINSAALGFGLGCDLLVKRYDSHGPAVGIQASIDQILVKGRGDNFWRVSGGIAVRFKKD